MRKKTSQAEGKENKELLERFFDAGKPESERVLAK